MSVDGVGPFTTSVIQMPTQSVGSPGTTINDPTTMNNIAAALDNILGTIWPGAGSVNVREVGSTSLAAQVPTTNEVGVVRGPLINFRSLQF